MSNEIVNTGQAEVWEKAGPDWLRKMDLLDRQFNVHSLRALDAADPTPGEAVLDIGSGSGTSSLQIAERLGSSGSVLGADISSTMVEGATKRAEAAGVSNLSFMVADLQIQRFDRPFDLVFSQFGVMFFADPSAAFANIHAALKPTGRIAFVCWQAPSKNSLMTLPRRALASVLPAAPAPDPNGPGPFMLSDSDALSALIEGAGFSSVAVRGSEAKLNLGRNIDEASERLFQTSPVMGNLDETDPPLAKKAQSALRDSLVSFAGPNGVELDSATWIVTAQA